MTPGQLLLVGVPGPELDSATAALFRRVQPGGFILFGRNIQSPRQLRKLLDDLRELSRVEPVLTIDQEGGRVSRLRVIGTEPPSARQLREAGRPELIAEHGRTTGRLLRLFGFNLNLCPVLDIALDEDADNSLRGRCYGRTPEEVVANARRFNDAMRAEGILSCGKHFPGYTRACLDPHHELPSLALRREDLEALELKVFRAFTSEVDSMMIGHVAISGLEDNGPPASLSRKVVEDVLRRELGYRGLVMTDDLDMGAILAHFGLEEALGLALDAGNDLLMLCHRVPMAEHAAHVLGRQPARKLDRALEAIARFKACLAPPEPFSEEAFTQADAAVRALRIAVLGEERAGEKSPEDGKRSPVELY